MKQVIATMAGIVVQLLVKPGDSITEGTEVAILESMKMQIPITCEVSGKVSNTLVTTGDFVNEGDAILTLD